MRRELYSGQDSSGMLCKMGRKKENNNNNRREVREGGSEGREVMGHTGTNRTELVKLYFRFELFDGMMLFLNHIRRCPDVYLLHHMDWGFLEPLIIEATRLRTWTTAGDRGRIMLGCRWNRRCFHTLPHRAV